MKILIIGNADSVWIKEYCDWVLMKLDCQITISSHYNTLFRDFYQENKIEVIKQSWRDDCTCLERMFYFIKELATLKMRNYDYVHIHSCGKYSLRLAYFLTGKKIATFWGSDLLRISQKSKKEISNYLSNVDKIVVLTKQMFDTFVKDYYLKGMADKVLTFDFGITNLFYLKNAMENLRVESCKRRFGLPENKIVIAIGYNKSESHQHIKVVTALKMLPEDVKENICLLLHMSYLNCSEKYWRDLMNLLNGSGCEYVVLTDFIQGYDVARLRMAVDIYINAQITDALSATLVEYIFMGTMVLNGSWLKYDELDGMGIKLESFAAFEELPLLIEKNVYKNQSSDEIDKKREIIWNNFSWEARSENWLNLYKNGAY